MKPLFSVVVIGKNEEQTLPKLCQDLVEFKARGGDLVFVDTGSTDQTAKIAEEFGFKVTRVKDKFDFVVDKRMADEINQTFVKGDEKALVEEGAIFFNYASARNFAMSLAENNFIIAPDCDERLTKFDIDKIDELVKGGATRLSFDYIFSHYADGSPWITFYTDARSYDRRAWSWKGVVHEVLQGDSPITKVAPSVLMVDHWQVGNQNRTKYLAGLALACLIEPTNDRNLHYFGRELLYQGRPNSCIEVLKRHLTLGKWDLELQQSCIFIGDALLTLQQEEAALTWYNVAITKGNRREPWIRLAKYWYGKKNYALTAAYAQAALQIPYIEFYMNEMENYTFLPHHYLYWALWYLGRHAESKLHWKVCLTHKPTEPIYVNAGPEFFDNVVDETMYTNEIPGWIQNGELNRLHVLAKDMGDVAEIGSWKGRSTHALLTACKGTVFAIDHFQGSVGEEEAHAEAKTVDVHAEFLKNVDQFPNLKVIKLASQEAVKEFTDGSVDMVFLDGGHTYDEIKADIAAWAPKVTKLICGHDYNWPDVKRAVDEYFGPVEVYQTLWIKRIKE